MQVAKRSAANKRVEANKQDTSGGDAIEVVSLAEDKIMPLTRSENKNKNAQWSSDRHYDRRSNGGRIERDAVKDMIEIEEGTRESDD